MLRNAKARKVIEEILNKVFKRNRLPAGPKAGTVLFKPSIDA
jgi:hypothetical protein